MKYIKAFEQKSSTQLIEYIKNNTKDNFLDNIIKLVTYRYKFGTDLNAKDSNGDIALNIASYSGQLNVVKILIDAGADVNIQNDVGVTALMLSAYHNHLDVVKELIKAGANLDLVSKNGNTALIWSAYNHSDIEIMKELIKAGADWNIKNDSYTYFFELLPGRYKEIIKKEFPKEYEDHMTYLDMLETTKKYNL